MHRHVALWFLLCVCLRCKYHMFWTPNKTPRIVTFLVDTNVSEIRSKRDDVLRALLIIFCFFGGAQKCNLDNVKNVSFFSLLWHLQSPVVARRHHTFHFRLCRLPPYSNRTHTYSSIHFKRYTPSHARSIIRLYARTQQPHVKSKLCTAKVRRFCVKRFLKRPKS